MDFSFSFFILIFITSNGNKIKIIIHFSIPQKQLPFLHLKRQTIQGGWEYCKRRTSIYFDALQEMAKDGISFEDKIALVTGCGRDSIGNFFFFFDFCSFY